MLLLLLLVQHGTANNRALLPASAAVVPLGIGAASVRPALVLLLLSRQRTRINTRLNNTPSHLSLAGL